MSTTKPKNRKPGETYIDPENGTVDDGLIKAGPKEVIKAHGRRSRKYGVKGSGTTVLAVEHYGTNKKRQAIVGTTQGAVISKNPAWKIAKQIREALRPELAPKPVRSLKDMSPEEQARMRALYEKKKP